MTLFSYILKNDLELPKVPVIYDTTRRLNSIALPYEEGSDLTLVCEVAGGSQSQFNSIAILKNRIKSIKSKKKNTTDISIKWQFNSS